MCNRLRALLGLLLITLAAPTHADRVHAAVAANFAGAMGRLAPLFEARTGHQLVPSFGASGQLYAQINQGAPFDIFLSADDITPRKLVASGHGLEDTEVLYARGRLALWSAAPGYVDNRGAILASGDFKRLAMANPKTAPYGRAALETLTGLGLEDRLRPRFVTGESVAQTHQFVASGNVPLGFVALAQVLALPVAQRGSHWLVPANLHQPIDQRAVLLRGSRSPEAASASLYFLQSPEATAIIRELGYETPADLPRATE